jgi:hypothetical protein
VEEVVAACQGHLVAGVVVEEEVVPRLCLVVGGVVLEVVRAARAIVVVEAVPARCSAPEI